MTGTDGDPVMIVPPSPIWQSLVSGPLSQERIEDLQLWSVLHAMGLQGWLTHPVSIRAGADPPDRVISVGGVQSSGVNRIDPPAAPREPGAGASVGEESGAAASW
jgi:hypothetical protein